MIIKLSTIKLHALSNK